MTGYSRPKSKPKTPSLRERLRLRTRCKQALRFVVAILPVAAILALNPIVVIRIGRMRTERIGHYIMEPELLLSEDDAFRTGGTRTFDVWFENGPACNQALRSMWRRSVRVWPRWLCEPIRCELMRIGFRSHVIATEDKIHDGHDLLIRTSPHLSFSSSETQFARKQLQAMGIPEGAEWICLYNRDSAYLDAIQPGLNWRYHDYRDSNIENYVPAAEALADRGYWVVRMGAIVEQPMLSEHPRIIDYASSSARTDLLDLYLGARCRFFLDTNAGICAIPTAFRRPQFFVNFVPMSDASCRLPLSFVIFKHHVDKQTGRELSLDEIAERGVFNSGEAVEYTAAGVTLVENTADEIKAAALQMDDSLIDPTSWSLDDQRISDSFWKQCRPYLGIHGEGTIRLRVPTSYAKQLLRD